MSEFGPVLLMLGFVVVAALFGYLSWKAAKERREAFMALAAARGWTWTDRDDTWADRFGGDPFGQGSDRKAHNVVTGTYESMPVVAFDYSYETYSTDSKGHRTTHVHRYAVCALSLPAWLPTVEVTPENMLTRFAGALGMGDVQLESEDFNRSFRVTASDPKFACDVLHPRTMEFLLARPRVSWRVAASEAICWDDGRHSIEELDQRLATLHGVVSAIPSFIWNDARGQT